MRKFCALLMFAAFAFTALVGVIPAEAFSEARRVEDSAIAYLREAADAQYFYKEYDPSSRTIAGVSEKERSELAKKTAAYADFRSARRADMPYDDTAIATGELKNLEKNLELHKKSVAYYAHLGQLSNSTYKAFAATYDVVETKTEGDIATIDLYETLDFQYSDVDFDSSAMTHFLVSMVKHGGKWLVMSVESDDDLYATYREKDFDLEAELAGIDAAREMSEKAELDEAAIEDDLDTEHGTEGAEKGVVAPADRSYNKQYAVNYALTYTQRGYNGVGGASGASAWKNTNFNYGDADCMRFASQCMWAGLGGSNDLSSINAKLGMDTQGQEKYCWYGTETTDSSAWKSTVFFKAYVYDTSRGATGTTGTQLVSDWREVGAYSNVLTGGKIKQSDLLGAVCLVHGKDENRVDKAFRHAIVLTQVNGNTRDTVCFTAYNHCFRNYKLSNKFPIAAVNAANPDLEKIFVVAPRYMRNGNANGANYLYGDLLPAVARGQVHTVTGRAFASVKSLKMDIYKPNGSKYASVSSSNSAVISKAVTFDTAGLWKIVVSGNGLKSFTFKVRVAYNKEQLYSDYRHNK